MDRAESDDLSVDPTADFAYAEETASLKRLARTLVADEATADDVVQEVWLASLDHRPSDFRSHRAWLQAVTRNLAFKAHRKRRRQADRDRRGARSEVLPGADLEVEARATQHALLQAVDGLGAPYAEVLRLRFFEELKVREIAERLERPEGSVKTYLARGLSRLRRRLDGEYGGGRAWSLALLGAFDWDASEVPRLGAASALGGTGAALAWLSSPVAWVVAIVLVGFGGWALWAAGDGAPRELVARTGEASDPRALDRAPAPDEVQGVRTTDFAPTPDEVPGVAAAAETELPVSAAREVLFRARDEDGYPLAGVEVIIERNLRPPVPKGRTGADGALRVVVEDTDIDEMVTAPGRSQAEIDVVSGVPQVRLYGLAPGRARSSEFVVPLPEGEPRELSVTFGEPALVLSGRVRDDRGEPVSNAKVRIGDVLFQALPHEGDILRSHGSSVVRTDAAGAFHFAYARAGHQLLFVEAPGHLPGRFERDARGSASATLDLQVMRALTVRGVARQEGGAALAGVEIWAEVNERMTAATSLSGPDGAFVLDDVPPGKQILWARGGDRLDLVATTEVAGGAGEERIWNPVLTKQVGVHVALRDEDGQPLVGWYLYAKPSTGKRTWTERRIAGLEGGASFFRDPGVPITVQLFEGNPLQTGEISPLKTIAGLVPKPSPYVVTVTAVERGRGRLKGVLQDHEGAPLGGIRLFMMSTDFDFYSVVPYDEATGSFDLKKLPPGSYKLRIQSAVAGTVTLSPCEVLADEVTDLAELRMPAPGRLSISSDWPQTIDGEPVTVVFGLYYEQDGEGKYVMLQEGFEPLAGTYDVFPGTYTVGAKVGGKTWQKRSSLVRSGEDIRLETKPDAGFWIPLEVAIPAELGTVEHMAIRVLSFGADEAHEAPPEVVREETMPAREDGTYGELLYLKSGVWGIQVGDQVQGWFASTKFTLDDQTLAGVLRLELEKPR